MPKAGEFLKAEDSKTPLQATMTPRDFLNKIYILRYEDVIENLKINGYDRIMFLESLKQLYWDFVVPRAYSFSEKDKSILKLEKIIDDKDDAAAMEYLRRIAELLHRKGFVKTEKTQTDDDHVLMEKKTVIPK